VLKATKKTPQDRRSLGRNLNPKSLVYEAKCCPFGTSDAVNEKYIEKFDMEI
jgi:hypothetical protein